MNSTPTNTAIAAGAGAVVAPVVAYAAAALHVALPADVQGAIVVLIVAGAHWLSQRFPVSKQPSTTAQ
ncbi:hypothetical protein LFL96_21320 [Paraburkholderia sp. D15]|uniref:hypothetical protein n=1 Tax=Paraburkholderia sp. D15 TaxID=2880218 RepID=UPI00247832AB|nr:hypothetical protein [Paraburkholderia sp. D15]WGS53601.1 hypothetical protein LFL96_21320 [Paraburkholderia sp. D15]